MAQLGRVASVGDVVDVDGGRLRVERMDGRRIDRVKFIPDSGPDSDDAHGDHGSKEVAR